MRCGERQPANGFANANIIAIPTPIRNAASIRPASRNILVCSVFISSGWRAAASMYLPPMMPMPMQAPMAPKPMIRPAARATNATLVIVYSSLSEMWVVGFESMALMRLPDVHHRQHHEDEGLQQDDQDVEQQPQRAGDDMAERQEDARLRQVEHDGAEDKQHERCLTTAARGEPEQAGDVGNQREPPAEP